MSKGHILVIDDQLAIRELVARTLEVDGFTVSRASNGEEGLCAIQKSTFDLIILDVMMPVMDGFTFLQKLRAASNTTPTVVLSAASIKSQESDLIAAGADKVLAKPVVPKVIKSAIDQLLGAAGPATE